MSNSITKSAVSNFSGNYLWFLTLSYTVVIILANWFDVRIIRIFDLTTDAGTLVFPFTFLLSDLITEVYGFKQARRAVWCGFLFNLIFILYGQVVIHLPGPDYQTNNSAFDSLFAFNIRIILASVISYLCSEPLNAFLMAKLKMKMNGRFLGFRFVLSTFFASGVDSFIFGSIAFYAVMSNANLLSLILTMWFIKVAIEILGIPLSVKLAKKLKHIEQIDMYDRNTKFRLFSLEAHYSNNDNELQPARD
jgi:uncharacterized integral membrane protein (TIGR00697 family)